MFVFFVLPFIDSLKQITSSQIDFSQEFFFFLFFHFLIKVSDDCK